MEAGCHVMTGALDAEHASNDGGWSLAPGTGSACCQLCRIDLTDTVQDYLRALGSISGTAANSCERKECA